jgi:hypothetical protein
MHYDIHHVQGTEFSQRSPGKEDASISSLQSQVRDLQFELSRKESELAEVRYQTETA